MDTVSRVSLSAKEGECVTIDKFICYSTSLDMEKEKLEAFDQVITTADLLDGKYLLVQRGKKKLFSADREVKFSDLQGGKVKK